MNTTITDGENPEFWKRMIARGPHVYTAEELYLQLKHYAFKFILELIHFDNLNICDMCRSVIFFLINKLPDPGIDIGTMVNPAMCHPFNHAEVYMDGLVKHMIKYREGGCPQLNIIPIAYDSCLSAIDLLGQIEHTVHLTRAKAAISKIFYYLTYRGEPSMPHEDYAALLNEQKDIFLKSCTANAEILAERMQRARALKTDTPAAKIYRMAYQKIQNSEMLTDTAAQLLSQTERILKKQDEHDILLGKNTDKIIRVVRGEEGKEVDSRSPAERNLIDRAVELFVYRRDIKGVKSPESACIRHIWKKYDGEAVFKELKTFDNAVRYDKANFYDLSVVLARVKAHPPKDTF